MYCIYSYIQYTFILYTAIHQKCEFIIDHKHLDTVVKLSLNSV